MFTRAQLKTNAKSQLSGNWGMGVAATLIVILIGGVCSGIFGGIMATSAVTSAIMSGEFDVLTFYELYFGNSLGYVKNIVEFLVNAIFGYGAAKFYLTLSRTKNADIGNLFSAFKHFGKVLGLYLLIGIYTGLWTLLFIIPGIVASYRYRMAPYILVDNPDIGVGEAIRRSKAMMRGHKGELFVLDLSFIGWGIPAAISFGIGGLWLTPYQETTYANYYDALCGNGIYSSADANAVTVEGEIQ